VRIRFHREAGEELDAAAAWYEEREAGLGGDLLGEVDRAIAAIEESPASWPLVRRKTGLRRFLLARFPYAILYERLDDELRILAVSHTRRRPGYWRKRRFP
jgi:toxin ParE1/3/4